MSPTPAVVTPKRGRGRPITKTSTALIKAKDILEKGRWIKGCLKAGGGHCAIGAVYEAVGTTWRAMEGGLRVGTYKPQVTDRIADMKLATACEMALNDASREASGSHSIISFNDGEATKKKDVLAVFDLAITNAKRAERSSRSKSTVNA